MGLYTLRLYDCDNGQLVEIVECKKKEYNSLALELDSEYFIKVFDEKGILVDTYGNNP